MATVIGAGFDLSSLDQAINKAQAGLEGLVKQGKITEQAIVKNFNNMATQGVGNLLSMVEKTNHALESIGKGQSNAEPMKKINESAAQAVNHTTKFMELMAKINNDNASKTRNSAITKVNEELEVAKARLEELRKLLNYYAKGEGKKGIGFGVDTSEYQKEAKSLLFRIDALEREKQHLQANARLRMEVAANKERIANGENQRLRAHDEKVKESAKVASDAAKKENEAYQKAHEDRKRQLNEQEKYYDSLGRKMRGQSWIDMGKEYEQEEKYRKQQTKQEESDRAKNLQALQNYAKEKDRIAKSEANAREAEAKAASQAWQQQLKARDAENKAYAESVNAKKKSVKDEMDAVVKRTETLDKLRAKEEAKEIARAEKIAKANIKAEEKATKAAQKEAEKREKERNSAEKKSIRDAENAAKKRAKLESNIRKQQYQSYITSYDGAIRTSDKSLGKKGDIERQIQAVKNLEAARAKLKQTDENYEKKLSTLNSRIKQHNKNISDAKKGAQELREKHSRLMNTSEQLGRAIAGVFSVSAIKGYINKLVDVRGEFELQHKSLQVLIQDVDKANKLWDKTVALAVKSPFRVKDLVTYTKQLAAYRVESDKLYDTTKMLADVSSGLGVDMNRLILAYGQVKAANFLRGTELRQFTEAGIPMLDELAKYFSEIENRAVSAADVFNRISKRGVSFEDVDAVFQRITGEGGVFYKMQEKQSETLKGMINNLRDSLDLMMNDIGQSQEGALKGMVSTTKDIVDNWRAIAVAIKQVGTAIAIMGLKNLVGGWKAVSLATFEGTAAMSGAARMGATLRLSLQKLFATMMAHPLWVLAAAIGAGIHAWTSYKKAIKEVNKQYDEASVSEMRRMDTLEGINSKIAKNNTIINDASTEQGEYNKAIADNKAILEQLKRDYPSIYDSIVTNTNGTIDLTNAIEEQNRKLMANIALQQQAKGKFFQESQSENYKDAVEDQSALQSALYKTRAAAMEVGANLKFAISQGDISAEDAAPIEDWIKKIKEAKTAKDAFDASWSRPIMQSKHSRIIDVDLINDALAKLSNAYNNYNGSLDDLGATLDNQMATFKVELTGIDTELGRGEWLQQQLDNLGILDKEIRLWAKDYISKKIELDIVFPEPKKDDPKLKAWQKTYNKEFGVQDNIITPNIDESFAGFKQITNEATTQAQEIERLLAEYKSVKELIDAINKAGGVSATLAEGAYQGEDLSRLQADLEDIMTQLDFFGADYEKKKKDTDNEALQRLKKQISLIREAARAYDEMRKLHDEAYAEEHVTSEYGAAFKEAGLGNISGYAFGTREDELNNLNKLKNSAAQVEEGMLELSKATAQVGVQVDNANQELADKKLFDAISDIFSNYEISLEMDKLNIPPDLAKRLFGLDSISLEELRPAILEKFNMSGMKELSNVQIYESDAFKSMSEARQKELKESLEKEAKMTKDARMERLKTYSQYLAKEQHERIKFKMEEIRKIAEIDAMNEFNEDEKAAMKENIRRETNENMAKSYWDDFEKSTMFVNLFDDMELATKQSLNNMKTHLESMRDSMIAAGLPASDLKEILDKINQVEEELESRDPFNKLKSFGAVMFGTGGDSTVNRKEFKEAKANEATYLKEAERLEEQEASTLRLVEAKKKELNTAEAILSTFEKGTDEYRVQENAVNQIREGYSGLVKQHQNVVRETEENNKELNKAQSTTKQWKEQVKDVGDGFVFVQNAVNQVGDALSTTLQQTGLMGEDDAAIFDSAMNVANSALGLGASIASGDIVGIITNGLSLIGNIAATGDAAKQKAINAELEKAKKSEKIYNDLVDKYEKLQKAMEKSFTIEQMNVNKKAMEENMDAQSDSIDEQIAALEEANAIEADKKKADQAAIDERNEQIEELRKQQEALIEQQEELDKQFVETMGGSYDYTSVAEQFLDAWLSAFEETGDGMKGLEDSFDDFWKNVIKKQVVYGGASQIMEKYLVGINTALENGVISESEKESLEKLEATVKENLNNFYEQMNDKYNLTDSETSLSGLQKGIQGITEDQADILSSYWNAVRLDVSAIRRAFESYISAQSGTYVNPMLEPLNIIKTNTSKIQTLLSSVVGESSSGAGGVRVYVKNWN